MSMTTFSGSLLVFSKKALYEVKVSDLQLNFDIL